MCVWHVLAHYLLRGNPTYNRTGQTMTYQLSSALTEILSKSKEEANKYGIPYVDSTCFLLALLHKDDSRTNALIYESGATPSEVLRDAEALMERSRARAETLSMTLQPSAGEIVLSADGQRILRLTLLEARVAGVQYAEEEHLFLAMLRDKDNDAGNMLKRHDITYAKMAEQLHLNRRPQAGYGYLSDEPEDYPGSGNDTQKSTKAENKNNPTSDTPVTDNYGTDLTKLASEGALDPVVGRHEEILRIAQILSRRKKNNPILIGPPGVGKSAVVEGLAGLIAKRQVPRLLLGKRIVALDMASLVAGTQYRGQFEERIRRLIQELQSHKEIILFIDEIHTIIGAGGAAGTLDAANILKPALARGEVQCIGATTTDEYRKSIEKDGALERRFQKLQLEPTSPDETLQILQNIKSRYEDHHNVHYTDDALEACVRLTEKYVTSRALPDKAIDALDEAGSRVHMTELDVPADIKEMEQHIAKLKEEKTSAARMQHFERAAQLRDEVQQLTEVLDRRNSEWLASQREHRPIVDADAIAEVVSQISGVPVQRLAADETMRLRGMQQALSEKVVAQDDAICKVVRAITRNRLGLKEAGRPVGTFLFVGPTGVGKTYLVKCLAEWMFGRKDALIRIDMSEYGEKFSASRLVGAPPGYVGYEEGGQLTERVRRHPYSVVLLDEIEKAHPDVFNMLLQVMDEGRMTDGNGTTVDFRNTIIIMTSNSGSRQLKEFGAGVGFSASRSSVDGKMAESIVRKALSRQFAPEFLNRLDDIVMFRPLNTEDATRIADLELGSFQKRLDAQRIRLELTPAAKALIVKEGFDPQYGARSLKRAIQMHIEDKLCDYLLDLPESKDEQGVDQTERLVRFDVEGETLKIDR